MLLLETTESFLFLSSPPLLKCWVETEMRIKQARWAVDAHMCAAGAAVYELTAVPAQGLEVCVWLPKRCQ